MKNNSSMKNRIKFLVGISCCLLLVILAVSLNFAHADGKIPLTNLQQYELGEHEAIDFYADNSNILTEENYEISAIGTSEVQSNSFDPVLIRDNNRQDMRSIVVVFLGDGFTSSQQGTMPDPEAGTFLAQVQATTKSMLQTHPYDEFAHLFKVYAVPVVSKDSGISGFSEPDTFDTSLVVDTYFHTYFTKAADISMSSADREEAISLAEQTSYNVAMIQILANANTQGGRAWAVNNYSHSRGVSVVATQMITSNKNNPWKIPFHGTTVHEFGHSFGVLADEHAKATLYDYRANMSSVKDPTTIKWSHWIGTEGITVRTFDNGYSVPTEEDACIMCASWANDEYCMVCSAEITRRLAYFSKEVFSPGKSPRTGNTDTDHPAPVANVIIPTDQNRILQYAFHGNTVLQEITINKNVESIGQYAFIGATGLRTIICRSVFPPAIESTTFASITRSNVKLHIIAGSKQAYIDAGWTGFDFIEYFPFVTNATGDTITGIDLSCTPSPQLVIPAKINGITIKIIGSQAFAGNTDIISVVLPASLTSIGMNAFMSCKNLTSIVVPNTLTQIGSGAFYGCSKLLYIEIPVGVVTIGSSAFNKCSALTIRAHHLSAPIGWSNLWNISNCPVIWDT